ncbi:CDP-alcohol phosphatidyltransferase family protein [Candidatus Poribacteria bacterium]|nr:MAG: CDP-alcohol phosphatidyltransferase family protein [Candidatus Poribacteria bacterium]
MVANTITLIRLPLTFGVIALFGIHRYLDLTLIASIVFIFALDAVDGIVARKRNETSEVGAVLDTLADRVIENTFWLYFAIVGLIPMWMPIAVMTRGIFTDCLQRFFGNPKSGWAHALTRSRISRALYGVIKTLAFICLASAGVFKGIILEQGSLILATIAVGFCLLRGLPFFFTVQRTPHTQRT